MRTNTLNLPDIPWGKAGEHKMRTQQNKGHPALGVSKDLLPVPCRYIFQPWILAAQIVRRPRARATAQSLISGQLYLFNLCLLL